MRRHIHRVLSGMLILFFIAPLITGALYPQYASAQGSPTTPSGFRQGGEVGTDRQGAGRSASASGSANAFAGATSVGACLGVLAARATSATASALGLTSIFVGTADTAQVGLKTAEIAKEDLFDCVAWSLANALLKKIAASIIDWINSGFNGSPLFVQDLEKFLAGIADEEVGKFIEGAGLSFLCSPFQAQVRIALARKYSQRRQASCTLSGVVNNVSGFFDSAANGGWSSFLAFTVQPQNNPFGGYLLADNAITLNITGRQSREVKLLDWGRGIFPVREAVPGSCRQVLNETGTDTKEECQYRTVTPGTAIENQLNNALSAGQRRLEVADEINEIIDALFAALVQKGLQSLAGLSSKNAYASNTGFGVSGGSSFDSESFGPYTGGTLYWTSERAPSGSVALLTLIDPATGGAVGDGYIHQSFDLSSSFVWNIPAKGSSCGRFTDKPGVCYQDLADKDGALLLSKPYRVKAELLSGVRCFGRCFPGASAPTVLASHTSELFTVGEGVLGSASPASSTPGGPSIFVSLQLTREESIRFDKGESITDSLRNSSIEGGGAGFVSIIDEAIRSETRLQDLKQRGIDALEGAQGSLASLASCWADKAKSPLLNSAEQATATTNASNANLARNSLESKKAPLQSAISLSNIRIIEMEGFKDKAYAASTVEAVDKVIRDFYAVRASGRYAGAVDILSAQEELSQTQTDMAALNQSTNEKLNECASYPKPPSSSSSGAFQF